MPTTRLVAVTAAMLLAVPALAVAGGPPTDPGNSAQGRAHRPATTQAGPPGPEAPAAAKARAYGRYCKRLSKKHVKGEKGTPFSRCVTAMAKLAAGKSENPSRACAPLRKTYVAGKRDTPYGKCVSAAAKLREDR